MPHVIVKLWPGKSEQQKSRLAGKITKDVMDVLNYGDESVSVAFEEISAQDWAEKVYKPDRLYPPSVASMWRSTTPAYSLLPWNWLMCPARNSIAYTAR